MQLKYGQSDEMYRKVDTSFVVKMVVKATLFHKSIYKHVFLYITQSLLPHLLVLS